MIAHTADTPAEPPTWTATPRKPKLLPPPGSCDAHVHVFGPRVRFPFAAGRSYMPSDAPKETLFKLHNFLGIERCVIVHTVAHGYDLAVTADALADRPGRYLGVALVPSTIADAELKELDAQGFRGARFHYMKHLTAGEPIEAVIAFGRRLAEIGWHLQLHMEPELIDALAPAIRRAAVPVMIDHMGRVDASRGLDQQPFRDLLALLADKNVWVKVSGIDRASRTGPPYADALPFAAKLVAEFGDRCVWGTDFPHPNHAPPIPDDGLLIDLLGEIAPTAALQAVLVDNPQRFYGFGTKEIEP